MARDTFPVWRDAEGKVHFEDRVDGEGRVEKGGFVFHRFVRANWTDGEMFELEARPFTTTRSLKANRYYWSVVLKTIADHTGQSEETIHDAMCALHLPNEAQRVAFFNQLTGESLTVEVDHRRTSKLTGRPFYDFVENVRQWALDFFQLTTPDPDPDYWRKREKVDA